MAHGVDASLLVREKAGKVDDYLSDSLRHRPGRIDSEISLRPWTLARLYGRAVVHTWSKCMIVLADFQDPELQYNHHSSC